MATGDLCGYADFGYVGSYYCWIRLGRLLLDSSGIFARMLVVVGYW